MAEDELRGALEKVIAPMVESDEGELFLVDDSGGIVKLHLRGRFAGCPGSALVGDKILRPLVQAVRPTAQVEISSGAILPEGATRIRPRV